MAQNNSLITSLIGGALGTAINPGLGTAIGAILGFFGGMISPAIFLISCVGIGVFFLGGASLVGMPWWIIVGIILFIIFIISRK